MLSKKQKVWLYIFGAMFLIPEILWGNIINILQIYFLPIFKNRQIFIDKPIIAFFIIVVEIVSVTGFIYLFNSNDNKINKVTKYIINVLLSIIFLILAISLYLSFVMSRISF